MTGGREEFPNVMEEGANDGLLIGPRRDRPWNPRPRANVIKFDTAVSYDFS